MWYPEAVNTRATALNAAVNWAGDRGETRRYHPGPSEVLAVAEQFARYLETGDTRPADEPAEATAKVTSPLDPLITYTVKPDPDAPSAPKPGPRPGPRPGQAVRRG